MLDENPNYECMSIVQTCLILELRSVRSWQSSVDKISLNPVSTYIGVDNELLLDACSNQIHLKSCRVFRDAVNYSVGRTPPHHAVDRYKENVQSVLLSKARKLSSPFSFNLNKSSIKSVCSTVRNSS